MILHDATVCVWAKILCYGPYRACPHGSSWRKILRTIQIQPARNVGSRWRKSSRRSNAGWKSTALCRGLSLSMQPLLWGTGGRHYGWKSATQRNTDLSQLAFWTVPSIIRLSRVIAKVYHHHVVTTCVYVRTYDIVPCDTNAVISFPLLHGFFHPHPCIMYTFLSGINHFIYMVRRAVCYTVPSLAKRSTKTCGGLLLVDGRPG